MSISGSSFSEHLLREWVSQKVLIFNETQDFYVLIEFHSYIHLVRKNI